MARYHINEGQIKEIEAARRKNKDKNVEKRLEALLLHAHGKKRIEIAEKTGFAKSYVSELVSKYCRSGLPAITENHYNGNRRNLSYSEEEELLSPFREKAEAGQIVDINGIKEAYEDRLGISMENNRGQIYRVLKRHGWRKVMPRGKHPGKAGEEDIEASKKLNRLSGAKWQIMPAKEM